MPDVYADGVDQVGAAVPEVVPDVAVGVSPEMNVNTRPQRIRRPNVRYSKEEYDLTHVFVTADNGIVGKYVRILLYGFL